MALAAKAAFVPYADYLAAEELSVEKHEYCHGVVVAMAGGTMLHAHLIMNTTLALGGRLAGKRCRLFNEALRIRIPATDLTTYPDLSVICGPVEHDDVDKNAGTNPTAIFEVLSPSTAAYDRGEKFDHYTHLASLQAYVLVDYKRENVVLYTRGEGATWVRRVHEASDIIRIAAIGVELPVSEIYAGWEEFQAG
jgi:Uma2 family endonuclease